MTTLQELQGMSPLEQAKVIYAESLDILTRDINGIKDRTDGIKDPAVRDMMRRDEVEEPTEKALYFAALIAHLKAQMSELDRLRFQAWKYALLVENLERDMADTDRGAE